MKEKLIERNNEISCVMSGLLNVIDLYSKNDVSIKESIKMSIRESALLLEQIENKTFTVAVIATVKAGKSTFLNALLGNEYLPTSNVPETSSILYIKHSMHETYLQKNSYRVVGQKEILEAIKERNKIFRENGVDSIGKYILFIPYKKIENVEGVNFQFVDTPGPNEAGNIAIKNQVEKILQAADVIVYLLDYTKLNTKDENDLVDEIKGIRSDLFNDAKNRLFFVINKIDDIKKNSLSFEETVNFVKRTLNTILGFTNNYTIHGIKAEYALLARMIQNGNFDRIDDLGKKAFGDIGWKETYSNEKKKELLEEHLNLIIKDSGILSLEDRIIDYIVNNSESIFYKSIVEKSIKIVADVENLFLYKREISQKSVDELKKLSQNLRDKFNRIWKELDEIDKIIKNFANNIQSDIKNTFDAFEQQITRLIDTIIRYQKDETKSNKDHEDKFWKTVEGFSDSTANVVSDFAAPGTTKSEKNENRKIMKDIYQFGKSSLKLIFQIVSNWNNTIDATKALEDMQTLNTEIEKIVVIAFDTIRRELESGIAIKNNNINRDLQAIINRANRNFFEYLNQELKIDLLKSGEIQLPESSGLDISINYDSFIDKNYKEKSGGLCKPKIKILYSVRLKKEELSRWWNREISRQKNISLKIVNNYINSEIFPRIEAVKNVFNDITRNYLHMINTELDNIKSKEVINIENGQALDESIMKIKQLHNKLLEENI
jgi:small GTP-binding protein